MSLASNEYVAGQLTEIAGPGLRVEAPVNVEAGDRVLLALKLGESNVVEGVGTVRRAIRREGEDSVLVVELVGLSREEVAKLSQETNAAAQEAVRQEAGEGAEVPAARGLAGGPHGRRHGNV
jgi:hypothetical protein